MTIEDDIAFFERVPTLNLLGRAALRILAIGADSAFIVQEGAFSLTAQQAEGGNSVVVGRGTLLGELALLTETVRPVTATAKEPSTVLRVPRTLFLKMLEGYPDAAKKLRDVIATRTEQSTREIYGVRNTLDGRRY
jgi:CRP-like cAMP-binding protein